MRVSDTIKQIRKDSGMSQSEVADRMGITRSTYSGYENDRHEMDQEKIDRFCAVMGVDKRDFFGVQTSDEAEVTLEHFAKVINKFIPRIYGELFNK